jgi:hypothetical protein
MNSALPQHVRAAITAPLRQIEPAALAVRPVVPVSREGWYATLRDAGLIERDLEQSFPRLARDVLEAGATAEGRGAAGALKRAVERFTQETELLMLRCSWLSALLPAAAPATVDLATATWNLAQGVMADATSSSPAGVISSDLYADWKGALDGMTDIGGPFAPDPFEAAFGVAKLKASDHRGVFSGPRLIGHYYGRVEELARRSREILSWLTQTPPAGPTIVRPAAALVLTPRPLLTIMAAAEVRGQLSEIAHDDPLRLGPMRDLKLRVDRSKSSHDGTVRLTRELDEASDLEQAGLLHLDIYRRMVEGQLRPWAVALMRVRGKTLPKTPELSTLSEVLAADDSPLSRAMANSILKVARNAAAHEDYRYNHRKGGLEVGDEFVTVAELIDATERCYALMVGAETGWACARAETVGFARVLDDHAPPDSPGFLDEEAALRCFGLAGFLPVTGRLGADTWAVLLDDVPIERCNDCFAALTQASRYLDGVGRFQVLIAEGDKPVIDVSREALDATWVVYCEAVQTLRSLPPATFLAANAWARLEVETPEVAARSVAWLATNDAVTACTASEAPRHPAGSRTDPEAVVGRATMLAAHLNIVEAGLAAAMSVLPESTSRPLQEALATVQRVSYWARAIVLRKQPGTIAADIEMLRELHEEGAPVADVPTLDTRTVPELWPVDSADELWPRG